MKKTIEFRPSFDPFRFLLDRGTLPNLYQRLPDLKDGPYIRISSWYLLKNRIWSFYVLVFVVVFLRKSLFAGQAQVPDPAREFPAEPRAHYCGPALQGSFFSSSTPWHRYFGSGSSQTVNISRF